jgi:hypothetical protein
MQTRQQIILETINNLMEIIVNRDELRPAGQNKPYRTPEQERMADESRKEVSLYNPYPKRSDGTWVDNFGGGKRWVENRPGMGKVLTPGTGNRPRFPNLDPGIYRPNRPELPSGLLPGGRSAEGNNMSPYYPPSRLPGRSPGAVPMPNPNRPGTGIPPTRLPGGRYDGQYGELTKNPDGSYKYTPSPRLTPAERNRLREM